jgi:NDP-mannose synthase
LSSSTTDRAAGPEHAIILAGGRGARLHPYTLATPKPLITVGRWTILEIILQQLRSFGITRVTLCVSFMADMIVAEFGDGRGLGLDVDYCVDAEPRGTAGPLAAVPDWTAPAVVMNSDILTQLDFGELHAWHVASSAMLTIAARVHVVTVDYGVLHVAEHEVIGLTEKPRLDLNVSAGIYVASPAVRDYVPPAGVFGMNDLVHDLLRNRQAVRAYEFDDEWYDLGTPERLAEARRSFAAVTPTAYLRETALQDRK